jgi:excinuclease UvrABC ATPase subunit
MDIDGEGARTDNGCLDRFQIRKELSKSDIQILQNSLRHGEGFLRIVIRIRAIEKYARGFLKARVPGTRNAYIRFPAFVLLVQRFNSCCEDCHGTGIRKVAYPSTLVQNKRNP